MPLFISCKKSLGPNCFNNNFFKISLHVVNESMTLDVGELFEFAKLLNQVNTTNLILLPKLIAL